MSQAEDMKYYWVRVQKEYAEYDRLGDEFWKLCRAHIQGDMTSGASQNACIRVATIAAALYRMEREFPSEAI